MEKKLNLHDLFGVLFPGAVLWAAILAFATLSGLAETEFEWSETLALLPVAYVTGLLIQQLASWRLHEANIALQLLDMDDQTFSDQFKQQIKLAFEEIFRLPADLDRRSRQLMFDQCYDYVIQQNKAVYVENHYATYSMCRSMLFVAPVIAVLVITLIVNASIAVGGRVFLIALTLAVTALALTTFNRARSRFIKRFAASVYRSFYSSYSDARLPKPTTAPATLPDDDE